MEFRELVGAVLEEEGERDGLVALHAFAAGPARRLEDAHVRLHLGSRHLLDHGERGRRAGRGEQRDGYALAVHVQICLSLSGCLDYRNSSLLPHTKK